MGYILKNILRSRRFDASSFFTEQN